MWEGTTLAKGYHRDGFGHEWAESERHRSIGRIPVALPNTILFGKTGQDLALGEMPAEFLKPEGSPRSVARRAGNRVSL